MINIFSINCGLAFAPYLAEHVSAYLDDKPLLSRVVRQAGTGLIISPDGEIAFRFEGREAALGFAEARHYRATIQFRTELFAVRLMSDEVVLANIGRTVLISHPQSNLWLEPEAVAHLVEAFNCKASLSSDASATELPAWLNVSTGAGGLLISDQRNGRWVLLGSDHVAELERRLAQIRSASAPLKSPPPPTVLLKGVAIHLQSAFRLAHALESFAETGEVFAYGERAPSFQLNVARSVEGLEVRDSNNRAALNAREARKWASIIRAELDRVRARQVERAAIKTVIAEGESGRWVLQWGDEVFIPDDLLQAVLSRDDVPLAAGDDRLAIKQGEEFLLLLDRNSGACVALTEDEVKAVQAA